MSILILAPLLLALTAVGETIEEKKKVRRCTRPTNR